METPNPQQSIKPAGDESTLAIMRAYFNSPDDTHTTFLPELTSLPEKAMAGDRKKLALDDDSGGE
jgi:hypothetical protein